MNGKMAKTLRRMNLDNGKGKRAFYAWPQWVKNAMRKTSQSAEFRASMKEIAENNNAV